MSWTDIPASVYAVGKPITSTSYGYLKDNIEGHDHVSGRGAQIGVGGLAANTVGQYEIANSGVGQSELKTAMGAVTAASTGINNTLPGGQYGFYPQTKLTGGAGEAQICNYDEATSPYATRIYMFAAGGAVLYAQQRYLQASPPYKIGRKEWGHFLYMLVNAQGDIVSSYEAEDPPWAYNGPEHNGKDSVERIQAVPHPFSDYFDKDPALDGLEIVLVDLRGHDIKKWKSDSAKQEKGILENLGHINKKGKIITPQEVGVVDIKGFTDRVKIRKA